MGLHGDHDDYGLPKVDVVVPDDARELDRDVIAYRREQRQRRRRERWQRIGRPFTRYGIAAPFIASAVLVALISGVLMTVISPRPGPRTIQVPPTGPQRLRPGDVGGGLPAGNVIYRHKSVPVTELINVAGVVLVVPRECGCDAVVQGIIRQAGAQRLQVWLIADDRADKDDGDVARLADGAAPGTALLADDPGRVLSSTYKASGLTAVLVRTDRIVRKILRGLQTGRDLTADLRPLQTPS
ncbi:hypothetical protein [Actinoallomurus iriomotensis]|uniref:Uncharacterized protein n=1 Tax=Actinoallomurus iriomotensis TaxID=478107 RepID=A0A9W6RX91_9ACTN|nr:hypothetical protein [Actinoallomurus iriomotensis]GLY83730.1 hypothetical protein Airi02_016590 [Actinoallomurus iriomotensis]